ncbi:hypothetical protein C0J52_10016 [Blattella germanica]|nr:hypothetical protein C0J52_10016 [Blattella germanica]
MAHGDSEVSHDVVDEETATPPVVFSISMQLDTEEKKEPVVEKQEVMDVDTMLSHAGDFNRYQYILMVLFSVINLLTTYDYFGQLFIFVIPEHWCRLSEFEDLPPEDTRHIWSPPNDASCSRYDVNLTKIPVNNGTPNWEGHNWTLRHCDSGWQYNHTDGYESIISEFNWVCDDSWKPALAQSMFFVGSVLGSLGLGIMSDHIGRLPVLILANMIAMVGNIATVFSSGLPAFAFCRMFTGMATDNNFVMMYIIVLEYMRPNRRTLGLNLCIGVFHTLACITVPWLAIWAGRWRLFILMITIPNIIIPTFYFCVPESASWLLSRGRSSAKMSVAQGNRNLLGLFKTPRLRRKILILVFKSITSVTKFPASLVILLLQDHIGRKAMASGSLFISGVFTIASGLFIAFLGAKGAPMVTAALAVVGRFGVNIAYSSGAQYAAELIPTEVRGQGVSAIHMVGYAATFFSSHILYLVKTLDKTLPVTLEDGEAFGEGEGIWEFAWCKKDKKVENNISTQDLVS